MSKEYILKEEQYYKLCELIERIEPCTEQTDAIFYLTNNAKQLTPPTEQEVCEALSEYFDTKDIFYRKSCEEFVNTTFGLEEEIVWLDERGNIETIDNLSPHLITMLGRFYEGLQ